MHFFLLTLVCVCWIHNAYGWGIVGGPHMRRCVSWGDPHQVTFDGRGYHYQGQCNYKYVTSCANKQQLAAGRRQVPFEIVGRHWACGGTRVTCMDSAIIELYNSNGAEAVIINLNRHLHARYWKDSKVLPNHGVQYNVRQYYNGRKSWYQLRRHGNANLLWVRTHQSKTGPSQPDVVIYFAVGSNMQIWIHQPTYQGITCGLCGRMNNNGNDDLGIIDNNGQYRAVGNVNQFGDSWISMEYPSVSPYCSKKIEEHKFNELKKCDGEKLCRRAWNKCINRGQCTKEQIEDSHVIEYCKYDGCEYCFDVHENPFNDPTDRIARRCARKTVDCGECNPDDEIGGNPFTCRDISESMDESHCSYIGKNDKCYDPVYFKKGPWNPSKFNGATKIAEIDVNDVYRVRLDVVINKRASKHSTILMIGNHPSDTNPHIYLHNQQWGFGYRVRTWGHHGVVVNTKTGTVIGKKYSIEVVLSQMNARVSINGQTQWFKRVGAHTITTNGKTAIWARPPWWVGADVTVSNLRVYSGINCCNCRPTYEQPPQSVLVPQKQRVITRINIAAEYQIEFDLLLKQFPPNRWQSILHIGNTVHENYPAILMHSATWGTLFRQSTWNNWHNQIRLAHIGRTLNHNAHWNIYISQTVLKITINDAVVYFNPRMQWHHQLKNRNVYVSAPWWEAYGAAQIRNLVIRNGDNDDSGDEYAAVQPLPNMDDGVDLTLQYIENGFKQHEITDDMLPKGDDDNLPNINMKPVDDNNNDINDNYNYNEPNTDTNDKYPTYVIGLIVAVILINCIITGTLCLRKRKASNNK